MIGRGVDQALGEAVDPQLFEDTIHDARYYTRLSLEGASKKQIQQLQNNPIAYIWNDAWREFQFRQPDLVVLNLETAITSRGKPWPGKGIHYRTHPAHVDFLVVLTYLTPLTQVLCCLANNHILDWGYQGLVDTLNVLQKWPHVHVAGAGLSLRQAQTPVVLHWNPFQVVIWAAASESSGVPPEWAATPIRPGVWLLPNRVDQALQEIETQLQLHAYSNGASWLGIFTLHFGANWQKQPSKEAIALAHGLIDRNICIVHMHSSHHMTSIEYYKQGLIFYGQGDFINDYENLNSHPEWDPRIRLAHFTTFDAMHRLHSIRSLSFRSHQLQLKKSWTRSQNV